MNHRTIQCNNSMHGYYCVFLFVLIHTRVCGIFVCVLLHTIVCVVAYLCLCFRVVFRASTLGRRCPSINRWRVRKDRGGLRWQRWRERKYHVGIYILFFWLKLAVFMVIRQYWKAPIIYMLYEILWVVIVVPYTQKNHALCIQLAILQSYSTTNL